MILSTYPHFAIAHTGHPFRISLRIKNIQDSQPSASAYLLYRLKRKSQQQIKLLLTSHWTVQPGEGDPPV